ncbi:hypothetical protein GCG54_00007920 [Colletotrichum gloeosporioides]|uniref:Secreted protein n=1 Tax=Colletotrichum gloeosporioides TaxID=474922 RepID=A0A8H4CQJ4_COLGL|nr:uncharacterized protein GCG54_00007920 [Colletotrichum gloeosporioides]KAF3808139.1 hypothetical protein GCG54_00007920 [Colletotrichum gloeosporioides]
MEYIWMGNFCRLLSVILSASCVVLHDQAGSSIEARPDMESGTPFGLMGMREGTDETARSISGWTLRSCFPRIGTGRLTGLVYEHEEVETE